MKIIPSTLACFLLLATPSAYSAAKTKIYTAQATQDEIVISERFIDSSFNYVGENPDTNTKAFCYVGDVQDVCPTLQSAVDEIVEEYLSGAHDTIELLSCSTGAYSVKARYRLLDDYEGDFTVERDIYSCGDVDTNAKATIFEASREANGIEVHSGTFRGGVASSGSSFCYSGAAEAVCKQIQKDLALTLQEYENGGYAFQELHDCSLDESTGKVTAAFSLHLDNDKAPVKVSKTMDACIQ